MFSAPTPAADTPGAPIEKGYFAIAHNYRMFALQNTKLNYSAPLDPSNWTNTDANAGFIDLSMVTSRKPTLVSMADYGGDLAIFGTRHIFVYIIDVVPSGDKKRQTIHGTGTFAPHSVVPWGVTDVMYLDISGIRSLRARDSSEQAFSADLGNLIDDLVRQQIATLTNAQKIYNVWGIVEPRSGRLWMALYDKIFDDHVEERSPDGTCLLNVDRHLILVQASPSTGGVATRANAARMRRLCTRSSPSQSVSRAATRPRKRPAIPPTISTSTNGGRVETSAGTGASASTTLEIFCWSSASASRASSAFRA